MLLDLHQKDMDPLPLRCTKCSERFSTLPNLTEHMRSHSSKNPIKTNAVPLTTNRLTAFSKRRFVKDPTETPEGSSCAIDWNRDLAHFLGFGAFFWISGAHGQEIGISGAHGGRPWAWAPSNPDILPWAAEIHIFCHRVLTVGAHGKISGFQSAHAHGRPPWAPRDPHWAFTLFHKLPCIWWKITCAYQTIFGS